MYLNKALIIGNLTRDPELKALPSGIKVCQFSLATNRVWKDKNGAKQEAADYHNVVVFGKSAELAAQYLKKGASALVEGRMQTRSWDDKEGKKNYRTEVVADRVQFGPRGTGAPSVTPKTGDEQPAAPADTIDYPVEEINPDDIPF